MTPAQLLPSIPEKVAARIKAVLPHLRECKKLEGTFNAAELKRIGARTPSVGVGLLRIVPRSRGEEHMKLDLAAYVVTRDTRGLSRADAALTITATITDLIEKSTNWAEPLLGQSTLLNAENLFSKASASQGVALWAIRWHQQFAWDFEEGFDGAALKELYVGHAPEIGPDHVEDYSLIGGDDA